jgi:hypothetical protein
MDFIFFQFRAVSSSFSELFAMALTTPSALPPFSVAEGAGAGFAELWDEYLFDFVGV